MRFSDLRVSLGAVTLLSLSMLSNGCAVAETKTGASAPETATGAKTEAAPERKLSSIKIEPNSPADVVRIFYRHLRERRFREAIYLTNLRPAIEQLSDTELKEYEVDLAAVARQVPAEVLINGEIITGDKAAVTAELPGDDPAKPELQELRLRKENGNWVILAADEHAEKAIKQAGRDYFKNLRIETHQEEAKKMLDRIAKAQMAHAAENGGKFGELRALVDKGFVPADALSAESTGYVYVVTLEKEGAKYSATATPAAYGKSGSMSYAVKLNEKGSPVLSSKDTGGKPMQN